MGGWGGDKNMPGDIERSVFQRHLIGDVGGYRISRTTRPDSELLVDYANKLRFYAYNLEHLGFLADLNSVHIVAAVLGKLP